MPKKFVGVFVSFCTAFLLELLLPAFSLNCQINFLIAPLVMAFYFLPKSSSCWLALFCGTLLDCFYSHPKMGITGLSYLLAALVLYDYRLYFFKDALSTLAIMTYLFSVLSGVIEAETFFLFGLHTSPLTFTWIVTDCLLMPLLDAACAFLFFSLPHFMYTVYYKRLRLKGR